MQNEHHKIKSSKDKPQQNKFKSKHLIEKCAKKIKWPYIWQITVQTASWKSWLIKIIII